MQEKVNAPAIGLMVTAIIGMLFQLVNILLQILGVGMGALGGGQGPGADQMMSMLSGGLGIVFGLIGLAIGAVILFGAMKMRKLESYGLSMAAAILAMIPCLSPCCILGLPLGIWALVVLMKPEVKQSFV